MTEQARVVILGAARTAIGKFGGTLSTVTAVELGGVVIAEALRRAQAAPEDVDEVLFGNVLQAAQGQNPARQAAVAAGLPWSVPALTLNKVCGSGLRSVALAAQTILAGDNQLVVAGGMENMSQSPYYDCTGRWGRRMGQSQLEDGMICDGLWDAFGDTHMALTAEALAREYGISRAEQDQFALESQRKAQAAQEAGRFAAEIVPVPVPQRKVEPLLFAEDEFIRRDCTLESLQKLKLAFAADGTVTAGNASGVNDGAAALVLSSERYALERGLKPLAYVRAYASAGLEPQRMGLGPAYAVPKALAKAGLTLAELDLLELNEAFAAQAMAVNRALKPDPAKLNVNGGALALGHPIGASGARILVTLLYELERRQAQYGLAALCIGGGMGTALIVERQA